MFFVLSGFLITSLLLDEHRLTGGIRLGAFYARRALRLYPALLVAVAGALTLAFLKMPFSTLRPPACERRSTAHRSRSSTR
jgi:peptidoglycan/LPS O-acetylase OafA/YrhL